MLASRPMVITAVVWWLAFASGAGAKVDFSIDIGWSGNYRVGHWTPIYVTASDDSGALARAVTLDIVTPQGSSFALNIRNQFVLHPELNTYLLYVPLGFRLDETVAVIRDAQSGKRLAEKAFAKSLAMNGDEDGPVSFATQRHGDEILIGVGGRQNAMRMLQRAGTIREDSSNGSNNTPAIPDDWRKLEYISVQVGFLDSKLLPDTRMGYDGLHLLVLNGPDLLFMNLRQQQAIAAWVKAGGRLLLWPGDGIVPGDSPIARLLPCKIGENEAVSLSVEDTKKLGIATRLEKVPGRKLTGLPGSTKFDTLLGKAQIHIGRAGIGLVAVLSVDASQLVFNSEKEAQKFWWPILAKLIDVSGSQANSRNLQPTQEETRRATALGEVVDRLGDVPGVGKFDFSYIAGVMIAMMFIVGPIDWFVLKKLGRQPWTWITTSGWIALVTFGALYVGRVFKSGELHYRTVRLIDQADGEVVGAMDVVGIYSPRTQAYGLNGSRDAWWEPANAEAEMAPWRSSRQRGLADVFLRQDGRGTLPESMTVNVWNLRFMQSELGDPSSVAPVIKAELHRVAAAGNAKEGIVGTVTNLSAAALRYPRLRVGNRITPLRAKKIVGSTRVEIEVIKPGQTVEVELYDFINWVEDGSSLQGGRYVNGARPAEQNVGQGFANAVCDLNIERADRIGERLTSPNLACIYAESEDVAPVVTLEHTNGAAAREKHWQVVRAIVDLK